MPPASSAIISRGTTPPPLGMAPSPALFLTAAAQRTRRIRLGPLVYLLPLYHPLRLIEESCMLDHLSGGRLELGVGRGVSPYELGYFGIEPADTPAIFHEALAVLIAGLTHERLTFEGQHYRYHDVPLELHPLQQPYPPLWYPTHNPESVEYAARHGFHFVGLGPATLVRQHHETILFGSPARMREQLARLLEVSGCNYVIGAFAWGTLPPEQTRRSLRLFAEEVAGLCGE